MLTYVPYFRISIDTCHEAMAVYVDKKYTGNVYGCIILRFVLYGFDPAKGNKHGRRVREYGTGEGI